MEFDGLFHEDSAIINTYVHVIMPRISYTLCKLSRLFILILFLLHFSSYLIRCNFFFYSFTNLQRKKEIQQLRAIDLFKRVC